MRITIDLHRKTMATVITKTWWRRGRERFAQCVPAPNGHVEWLYVETQRLVEPDVLAAINRALVAAEHERIRNMKASQP